MEGKLRLPVQIDFTGNVPDNFKRFKQNFEIYLSANGKDGSSDKIKIAIFLNIIGEEGVEIFNTLKLSEEDRTQYSKVIEEFEKYCNPKKNIVYERFKFFSRKQEENEMFDHFLTDLKKLAVSCEFGDQEESLIRDRIVLGINDKSLQEKLLGRKELDLYKAASECRSFEVTRGQVKMVQEQAAAVSEINQRFSRNDRNSSKNAQGDKKNINVNRKDEEIFMCYRCREEHGRRECKAHGKRCKRCGIFNHFAVACRNRNVKEVSQEDEEEAELQISVIIDVHNLNLNKSSATGEEEPSPLPCLVYVHGESYEWNSGNPYDGTVLASTGRVIVVTINFRLGVLGFLKTGTKGSAQGNFGLMDLVAGLHWLRENLPAFGGDPERVTLMGHGTGAALVNFIAVSPVAKELLHRVILLSGSGLSPWALQRDPLWIKRGVAKHTGCHGDLHEDDLAPCLRLQPLHLLLNVKVDTPRFLPGFAPFIDGTILLNPTSAPPTTSSSTVATSAGFELADFPDRDLLFGLASTESYLDLNAQDLEFGFNETKRDRILRTYVRNSYYYHLNEIFSTLKNEYTDWERPTQNPLSVRDATLDVLSDGHTAAPLIRIGYLHTMSGGKTFFLHFQHHSGERDFPMRPGSVRGEDLPYILGLPLIGGGPFFPHNYSHSDAAVSKTLIHYISNFVRKGDPNGAVPNASASEAKNAQNEHEETNTPYWDTYDTINQFYLELGNRPERRDHYRGHKMSLWLNLIPQLHRPGEGDDISMRHHHFQEEDDQYYDGSVRPQTKERPPLIHIIAPPPPVTTVRVAPASTSPTPPPPKSDTALQATTTECPPNTTILISGHNKNSNNNLLRKLASSHYQSYTTALTVTIAVGCFLLLLNILIFAGIYHQRDRGKSKKKQKEELAEAGSCSSSSGEAYEKAYESRQMAMYDCNKSYQGTFERKPVPNYIGEFSCDKRSLADIQMTELPLQEFNSSPPPAKHPHCEGNPHSHPPDVTSTSQDVQHNVSPSIPEPPPPPRGQPPQGMNQTGILRPHGAPTTPGTMKKRVQIQEISV